MGDFKPRNNNGRDRGSRGGGRNFGGGNRSFGGNRGGDRRGSFGGNRGGGRNFGNRKPLEQHDVICSKCKKKTQVPFKPTGDKPVYCRDCFDGGDSRGRRNSGSSSGVSKEQFEKLEKKIDQILELLSNCEVVSEEEE